MDKPFWLATENGLCAIDTDTLDAPISIPTVFEILKDLGFQKIQVDVLERARSCIGVSSYRQTATMSDAPKLVNCRTLISWAYACAGVGLPHHSLARFGFTVNVSSLQAGDALVVTDEKAPSGRHIGLLTGPDSVIHAQTGMNVVEVSREEFLRDEKPLLAVRFASCLESLATFRCPPEKEVRCSLDFVSIIRRATDILKS